MLPVSLPLGHFVAFGIYVNVFGVSRNAKEGKEPARRGPPRLDGVAGGLTERTPTNPSKPSFVPEVLLADPRARIDPRWVFCLQRAAGNKSVSAMLARTKTDVHLASATTGEMLRQPQHQTCDSDVTSVVLRKCDEGRAGSQRSGGTGGRTACGKDAASSDVAWVQRAPIQSLPKEGPFSAEASDAATRRKKARDEVDESLKTGDAELDRRAKERVHAGDDLNKLWQTITSSHEFELPLPRLRYSRYFLKYYFTASAGQPPDPDVLYYKLVEIDEAYLQKKATPPTKEELEAARTANELGRRAYQNAVLQQEIAKLEKQLHFDAFPGKVQHRRYFIGLTPATSVIFANPTVAAVAQIFIYCTPLGEGMGITEAIEGRSLLTGEKLSLLDRVLGGLPLASPILRGGKIVIRGVTIGLKTAAESAAFIVATAIKAGKTPAQILALAIKLEGAAEHIGELRKVRTAIAEGRALTESELNALKSLDESLGQGKSTLTHPASGEGGMTGTSAGKGEQAVERGAQDTERAARRGQAADKASKEASEAQKAIAQNAKEVEVHDGKIECCLVPVQRKCPSLKEAVGKAIKNKKVAKEVDEAEKLAKAGNVKGAKAKATEAIGDATAQINKSAKTSGKELAGAEAKSAEKEMVGEGFKEGPARVPRPGPAPKTGRGKAAREIFEGKLRNDYAKRLGVPPKAPVHHAIELQTLDRYPGVYTEKDLNAFENMRGIATENNGRQQLHASKIREIWDRHYARMNEEIKAAGLKPGTPKYIEYVKTNLVNGRNEIDDVLGQFFTEYRTGRPRSFK